MVAELGIGAGTVVGALVGVLGANRGARPSQLLATAFAEQQVSVAVRVGAVDEAIVGLLAVLAAGNNRGIDMIHIYGHAGVEYVALAVEVLAARLDAILDNAAVQLVHVLETLFEQEGAGFFALHATGAVGQNLFILELPELLNSLGKVAEVLHI